MLLCSEGTTLSAQQNAEMMIAFWMPFISNPSAVLHPLLRIAASAQNEGAGICQYLQPPSPYLLSTSSSHATHLKWHSSKSRRTTGVIRSLCHFPPPPHLSSTCSSALNTVCCREDDIVEIQQSCHLRGACSNCCLCSRQADSDLGDGCIKHNWKQGNHI